MKSGRDLKENYTNYGSIQNVREWHPVHAKY